MLKRFYGKDRIIRYIDTNRDKIKENKNLRDKILLNKSISIDYLIRNTDIFPIEEMIVADIQLPLDYVYINANKIDWFYVSRENPYQYRNIWNNISKDMILTWEFCDKYWKHLNWTIISKSNCLEEKVLLECGYFIIWEYAQDYRNQVNLTDRVVKRYYDIIDLDIVAKSPRISQSLITELKEKKCKLKNKPLIVKTKNKDDN